MKFNIKQLLVISAALLFYEDVTAYEITEKLALNGVLSGALQCQQLHDDTVAENTCKGAVPFQPELTYRPGRYDRLFLQLGFAEGNALNSVSPFILLAWGGSS